MALIRMLVLLVVFGGGTIFLLQNFSPALPLVFFGSKTLTLPVGLWLLLFLLAGALTGIVLQLINYNPRRTPKDTRKTETFVPPPPRNNNYRREPTPTPTSTSYPPVEPPPITTHPPTNSQPEPKKEQEEKVEPNSSPDSSFNSVYFPPQDKVNSPKVDKIHDANYRVIEPPNIKNGEVGRDEEDEEDWI
ncbi:MAG: hypothetical protein WA865_05510 [Spirulinaceae cyanobacterium]